MPTGEPDFWKSVLSMLQFLVGQGLPIAIVALLVFALLLWRTHRKTSLASAILAVVFCGLYVIVQLAPPVVDIVQGKTALATSPTEWSGVDSSGSPIPVTISVQQGGKEVARLEKVAAGPESWLHRQLDVSKVEGRQRFLVAHRGWSLGGFPDETLRDLGWVPAKECEAGVAREGQHAWNTSRVYAGQRVQLGRSANGMLYLEASKYGPEEGGVATLALNCQGLGPPQPSQLVLRNKAAEYQVFDGQYPYLIVLREADFQGQAPWAAFTVVGE